jgi:hypothetical protein
MSSLKSWIRKNQATLYVKHQSHFDGMTDCVESIKDAHWEKVNSINMDDKQRMGIPGAWFTRKDNYFKTFLDDDKVVAVEVYNCCGCFTLKTKSI